MSKGYTTNRVLFMRINEASWTFYTFHCTYFGMVNLVTQSTQLIWLSGVHDENDGLWYHKNTFLKGRRHLDCLGRFKSLRRKSLKSLIVCENSTKSHNQLATPWIWDYKYQYSVCVNVQQRFEWHIIIQISHIMRAASGEQRKNDQNNSVIRCHRKILRKLQMTLERKYTFDVHGIIVWSVESGQFLMLHLCGYMAENMNINQSVGMCAISHYINEWSG